MLGLKNFKDDLRAAGKRNPELLMKKLEKLELSELELAIMKFRYIDGLLIKQIPILASVGERWVKKIHCKATQKALDGWNIADLIDLGIPIKATPGTLYQA